MSFIKISDQIHSKFFTVSEDDCMVLKTSEGDYAEVAVKTDDSSWPVEYLFFRTREDAGQYVRDYWEDYIDTESPEEVIAILGAETLISWALGRAAGPGSAKVKSLKEWLDLYLDVPEEHFEEEYEVEAIGQNLVETFGFKPAVAFSRG